MPNVIVTPHLAYLTCEAVRDIAEAVIGHRSAFETEAPGRERLISNLSMMIGLVGSVWLVDPAGVRFRCH